MLVTTLVIIYIIVMSSTYSVASKPSFDPYTMNGGLVSAIAGSDYVIIASDTRMSQGYEILTRNHLSSRLWSAVPLNFKDNVDDNFDHDDDDDDVMIQKDGSIILPKNSHDKNNKSDEIAKKIIMIEPSTIIPTFIASSGCATDCEALKRQLRFEINSHLHWNHGMTTLTSSGIANLLGQTLYSRRGFPFYSFCILAGLEYDNGGKGCGIVHTYDAIGSHEKVAVATAGTGREMLQPILDRFFASVYESSNDDENKNNNVILSSSLQRDGKAVHASEQRVGLKLKPPVQTYVTCSSDEAVSLLVRGYRSVAEREIAVGDNIVVCIIKKSKHKHDIHHASEEYCEMQVLRFPLKAH